MKIVLKTTKELAVGDRVTIGPVGANPPADVYQIRDVIPGTIWWVGVTPEPGTTPTTPPGKSGFIEWESGAREKWRTIEY